jgi:hypothetical protein
MNSNDIFEYQKKQTTVEELLTHPSFSHTRVSNFCNFSGKTMWVYFKCSDSPSGVLMAGSFNRTPETDALMAARKLRANLGPSRGDIAAANPPGTLGFGTSLLTGKTVTLADPKGLLK